MTRRAVCFGINYPGTSSQLAGCVNDAWDWRAAFIERGFDEVSVYADGECTRATMLKAMDELIAETGPDDLAVITYSGHGSWRPDRDGDEADRRDELLCPVDYDSAGMIADDDLYRVFTSGHRWARVVFISDSCHSGSVNRLAPALSDVWVPNDGASRPERRVRFLPPSEWMAEPEAQAARAVERAPSHGKPRASALLMAACRDTEVAYDAWFDGRANGAYTYAALRALRELPEGSSYRGWQRAINRLLPSQDYAQTPRLDATPGQARWTLFEETGER